MFFGILQKQLKKTVNKYEKLKFFSIGRTDAYRDAVLIDKIDIKYYSKWKTNSSQNMWLALRVARA